MTHPLSIHTLGGVRIEVDGRPINNLASRKAEALLVYLACHARPHPRETLATMLWSDQPHKRGLANLSVVLSSLRKQIGDHFNATRQEIEFTPPADTLVDATAFTAGVQAALEPGAGPPGRDEAVQLRHALDLYQGSFLDGFYVRGADPFEEWVLLERERLEQLAAAALGALTRFYLQRRHFQEGIATARQLLALDPLNEAAHRHLMALHAHSGHLHLALEQFESCRQLLADDLGVDPLPETIELAESIREQRFQPLEGQTTGERHNLPAPTTALVGRRAEIGLIKGRLGDQTCRLITLVGPGGVGKTKLIIEAARTQIGHFLDGVWFIPLAALPRPDLIPSTIADVVGFDFSGSDLPWVQLTTFLANKEILLVLDGFEHLLTEDTVDQVNQLLIAAPRVRLLISSRIRLNIQAEWLVEVNGLASSSNGQEPGAAEALFAARARQVRPDFDLARERKAVRHICRTVDGLPLAIELAAAGLRYYSTAEIVAQIQQNLDFLASTQRDIPARHRSLRAVFDHSWQLLDISGREAFTTLAVFRGSFATTAVQKIGGTALPAVHDLIDQSLIQQNENGRLLLHDAVRHYALEKLEQDPEKAAAIRRSHALFYANFLNIKHKQLFGGFQLETLDEITTEMENIRVGWGYARQLDPLTPDLLPLLDTAADTLFWFFYQRSRFLEGETMLQEVLAWLDETPGEVVELVRQRLRARAGWFTYLLGGVEEGRVAIASALDYFTHIDSRFDIMFCCCYLATIDILRQDMAGAEALLERALALALELDQPLWESIACNMLGMLAMRQRRLDAAADLLTHALVIKREQNDLWGTAFSLEFLGAVETHRGRFSAAESHLRESLTIRERFGDRRGIALGLERLGDLAQQTEANDTAYSHYANCLALLEDIGAANAAATVRQKLAALAVEE